MGLPVIERQLLHHIANNLEPRSNNTLSSGSSPAAKTSGYAVAEVPDWQLRQWLAIVINANAALEAKA